jgi:hypothetical protein
MSYKFGSLKAVESRTELHEVVFWKILKVRGLDAQKIFWLGITFAPDICDESLPRTWTRMVGVEEREYYSTHPG